MSTQGLVSVVRDGEVVFKIIAGCNGYNAEPLAARLKEIVSLSTELVYGIAREEDFGCEDCLVVMDEKFIHTNADEVGPLYRETFQNPQFNPRWQYGTAAYTEVVEREAE